MNATSTDLAITHLSSPANVSLANDSSAIGEAHTTPSIPVQRVSPVGSQEPDVLGSDTSESVLSEADKPPSFELRFPAGTSLCAPNQEKNPTACEMSETAKQNEDSDASLAQSGAAEVLPTTSPLSQVVINEAVFERLSLLTKEIELRGFESSQHPGPEGVSAPCSRMELEAEKRDSSPPTMERPIRAIDVNTIRTPPQYQKHISLRGFVNLNSQFLNNPQADNVFKIHGDEAVQGGEEIGHWEGMWGMNDAAFVHPNGILSPFRYSLKKAVSLLDDEETAVSKPKVIMSGFFKLKSPNAPDKSNPYLEVEETDVVLELETKCGEEHAETKARVIGSGQNKYGLFRLVGEYDLLTNELSCYREYLKSAVKPKGRQAKRKSISIKKKSPKRPRPGSVPTTPINTSLPVVSPMIAAPTTPGTLSVASGGDSDLKPKRERKTPSHFQDQLNPKTMKPLKKQPDDLRRTKTDWDFMHEIVEKLILSDKECWFTQPVDAVRLGLANYHDVIKQPMDLGTVRNKLQNHLYDEYYQVVRDIRLVFTNAMHFNPPKHAVHTVASMHLRLFERDLKHFEKEKEKHEKHKMKQVHAKMKAKERQKKEKQEKKKEIAEQKEAAKLRKAKEKELKMRKKEIEEQTRALLKPNQSLKSMFSSSDEDENSDSGEDSDDESDSLTKQIAATVKKGKKKKKKPKKQKPKDTELTMLKKTVTMMNKQMEMMQQMHQTSLLQINRLNRELTETQTRGPSQGTGKKGSKKEAQFAQQQLLQAGMPYMQFQNPMMAGAAGMGFAGLGGMPVAVPAHPGADDASDYSARPSQKKAVKAVSYQEKKKLGHDMNQLPLEAYPDMIKILQDAGADLGDGDEVELEMDKLDDVVLRKLMKFVSKSLNKAKRSASVADMKFDDA